MLPQEEVEAEPLEEATSEIETNLKKEITEPLIIPDQQPETEENPSS